MVSGKTKLKDWLLSFSAVQFMICFNAQECILSKKMIHNSGNGNIFICFPRQQLATAPEDICILVYFWHLLQRRKYSHCTVFIYPFKTILTSAQSTLVRHYCTSSRIINLIQTCSVFSSMGYSPFQNYSFVFLICREFYTRKSTNRWPKKLYMRVFVLLISSVTVN